MEIRRKENQLGAKKKKKRLFSSASLPFFFAEL